MLQSTITESSKDSTPQPSNYAAKALLARFTRQTKPDGTEFTKEDVAQTFAYWAAIAHDRWEDLFQYSEHHPLEHEAIGNLCAIDPDATLVLMANKYGFTLAELHAMRDHLLAQGLEVD